MSKKQDAKRFRFLAAQGYSFGDDGPFYNLDGFRDWVDGEIRADEEYDGPRAPQLLQELSESEARCESLKRQLEDRDEHIIDNVAELSRLRDKLRLDPMTKRAEQAEHNYNRSKYKADQLAKEVEAAKATIEELRLINEAIKRDGKNPPGELTEQGYVVEEPTIGGE